MKKVCKYIYVCVMLFVMCLTLSACDSLVENGYTWIFLLGMGVPMLALYIGNKLFGFDDLVPEDE